MLGVSICTIIATNRASSGTTHPYMLFSKNQFFSFICHLDSLYVSSYKNKEIFRKDQKGIDGFEERQF